MTEVLITAPCSDEVKRRLREFENSCVFSFGDRKSDIGDAEAVIGEPRTEKIRQAKSLNFIQMTWAGADIYTCNGAFPQGIRLATASGAFGGVISEYVVGAVLCLYRRFPEYIENQRSALWRDAGAERTLEGKTALILGTGDIGSNIAKRLSAFGTKNIGIRRTGAPAQYFDEMHTLSNIDALLPRADLVIGCLPNTKETGHILNYDRLCLMKSDALFINVGRGSLIDTDALIRALEERRIAGAILDVLENEPLAADSQLWKMPNVLITPHISGRGFGHDPETEKKVWDICLENLRRYIAGEDIINEVDMNLGY
jgi:phosphoglycerate dehydrogenase-like enzyme